MPSYAEMLKPMTQLAEMATSGFLIVSLVCVGSTEEYSNSRVRSALPGKQGDTHEFQHTHSRAHVRAVPSSLRTIFAGFFIPKMMIRSIVADGAKVPWVS